MIAPARHTGEVTGRRGEVLRPSAMQMRVLDALIRAGRPVDAVKLAGAIGPYAYASLGACARRAWVEWDDDEQGFALTGAGRIAAASRT